MVLRGLVLSIMRFILNLIFDLISIVYFHSQWGPALNIARN